ncbi:hypothetical protein AJ80_03538 [Polytolypa hystricis UAMH7299]|uniref:Uncharacterized protein n=1 Tax=Polytolypa hystricis (strain UAMH7299) TaxID=1447883 RepID=A0A2B7YH97_POLH7|nr:hypothetical protein AJ80_03538 [Polytolypa hystricis UAMH7299]
MSDDEGASPRERVVEGCRRDQVHLLEEVMHDMESKSNEEVAEFFNGVTDPMGNHALHICAMYGSYDAMDYLFDIEFFECDPLTRIDKDTPLHLAVRYANEREIHLGLAMVKMMLEAGCDPRVRNKHGQKPIDLTIPQYKDVKVELQKAEYTLNEGFRELSVHDDDDDDDEGSASDSQSETNKRV